MDFVFDSIHESTWTYVLSVQSNSKNVAFIPLGYGYLVRAAPHPVVVSRSYHRTNWHICASVCTTEQHCLCTNRMDILCCAFVLVLVYPISVHQCAYVCVCVYFIYNSSLRIVKCARVYFSFSLHFAHIKSFFFSFSFFFFARFTSK